MPRPPTFLGKDPVVDDIWELCRHRDGVQAAAFKIPSALVRLPAVRTRMAAHAGDAVAAIRRALDDLAESATCSLTQKELLALRILLAIETAPTIQDRRVDLVSATPSARADAAVSLLYNGADVLEWWRRARPSEGDPVPPEWILYARLKSDLERLEPPDSLTKGIAWTPSSDHGADCASDDLVGTWKGAVYSPAMLRVEPAPLRPESVVSYLVIAEPTPGHLEVVNYVEHGKSVIVAYRVVATEEGRRLIAVYEATTATSATVSPTHRGAMFLTIHGDPATELRGPYWTDRLTFGRLSFTERRPALAVTFDAARRLWSDDSL